MPIVRDAIRPLWHTVNPVRLAVLRRAERQWIRVRTLRDKWLRRGWPARPDSASGIGLVVVNYNTRDDIAHLLFSVFRVVGRNRFERIVVVDNASRDDSPALLAAMADAGLIEVIFNRRQSFHGPGLNQAVRHIAARERAKPTRIRYVWVLDSDVIILRNDVVADAVMKARAYNAALLGQVAHDEIPTGYAHVSSLLFDAALVWRRSVMPFDDSGTPGYEMHRSVRRKGMAIVDFPYRTHNYVLHVTSRTLAQVFARGETKSKYYDWAAGGCRVPFHGNPDGDRIYRTFLEIFDREVGPLTPQNLVAACLKEELLKVPGIEPRRGAAAAEFVVTGVVGPPAGAQG